jgi:serine protease inhibitor
MTPFPTSLLLAAALAAPQSDQRPSGPPPSGSPQATVVQAVNGLGLDLYARLSRSAPADEALFLSPLSVAMALSMVAEGARDETLAELRRALHVPDDVPLAELHTAFAALDRRLSAGGGDTSEPLAARIRALRAELAAKNAETEQLETESDWRAATAAARLAKGLAGELNRLLTQVDRYELSVANAVWVERTFPLVADFAATLDRSYGTGAARSLDFARDAAGARQHINAWVAERTNDRIRDLLPPGSVAAETALVITNAVWFRGEWQQPFDVAATERQAFLLPGGGRSEAWLMRDPRHDGLRYAAFTGTGAPFATPARVPTEPGVEKPATYPGDDGFTMVELPYKGSELAMLVIAPRSPDGLPRVEALLTAEALARWVAHLDARVVDTALPRFRQDSRFELSDALQKLGLRRAFVRPGQPAAAQFAGISAAADPAHQVYIAGVHHRAWIEVEEKGTEAAAASAILTEAGAYLGEMRTAPFRPVFRADRPFVFLIRDVVSGAVLFVGRVVDPGL